MRLVRYGQPGHEQPGMVDAEGGIRSLAGVIGDITPELLAAGGLDRLRGLDLDPGSLEPVPPGVRLGPPISRTGNFVAVGLNYAEHATETDAEIPSEPILFNKAPSCLVGPDDDVLLPPGSTKTDWEVEIAFVIGRRASFVGEEDAMAHVAGYCVCNDVSERAYQLERGGQWVKGKCFPTFGPLGPWLVTPDEVPDPQALGLWLEVNGERLQQSHTSTMIFPIRHLVSLHQPFHGAGTRRRRDHRHPARGGAGHEARALPQARRHHALGRGRAGAVQEQRVRAFVQLGAAAA